MQPILYSPVAVKTCRIYYFSLKAVLPFNYWIRVIESVAYVICNKHCDEILYLLTKLYLSIEVAKVFLWNQLLNDIYRIITVY